MDFAVAFQAIAGGEGFMKTGLGDLDFAFDDAVFAAQDAAAASRGQKFCVGFDVIHQIEHLLRGKFDQRAFLHNGDH